MVRLVDEEIKWWKVNGRCKISNFKRGGRFLLTEKRKKEVTRHLLTLKVATRGITCHRSNNRTFIGGKRGFYG